MGFDFLLDVVGLTLLAQNQRIHGTADKVIVAIITDGQENSSKEYTLNQVKTLIQQAEEKEWEFIVF